MGNLVGIDRHVFGPRQRFDVARFDTPGMDIEQKSSFHLTPDDRVFVIGSCFAMNVREALQRAGVAATDAGLQHQYNTPSMLAQMRWAVGAPFDPGLVVPTTGGWRDLCRYHHHPLESRGAAVDQRGALHARIADDLRSSTVLLATLGLIEVWRDTHLDQTLNTTPDAGLVAEQPGRYVPMRLTCEQSVRGLVDFLRACREAGGPERMIVSVSPVPLAATFFEDDVLVANCISKSTLRVAAHEGIAAAREAGLGVIDYFPSYELCTLASRETVWRRVTSAGVPDGRHVRVEFVNGVVLEMFRRAYLPHVVQAA